MTMTADQLWRLARSVFEAQPFTKFLGAELIDAGPGRAAIGLPVRPELKQQHGFAHGGVVSFLADNALTFAGGLALQSDALTVEYKINYAKPATGHYLVAKAEAAVSTRRQAVCRCEIYSRLDQGAADPEERLVAVAQGTIAAVSKGARAEPR